VRAGESFEKIFGVAPKWSVINGRRKSLIDYPRRHSASADKSMIFDLGSAGRWALGTRWGSQ